MEVGGIGRPRVGCPNDQDLGLLSHAENFDTSHCTTGALRRIEHAARYTGAAHLGVDLLGPCLTLGTWHLVFGARYLVLGTLSAGEQM